MPAPTVQELQQRIDSLESQLRQMQALAAVGELTSTATHELNNVLMTVMNYARMGMRHRDDATRDKALKKILDASERAGTISRTVLTAARNRGGDFEPVDLTSLCGEAMLLLERELRKYRIDVETDLQPVPTIDGDGNQLLRVLINLVTNARQAMSGGGSLFVKTEYDAGAGHVILTIRDTGSGIPQEQLPKIFEPFFSTKQGPDASGKGGTGLGLAACLKTIEQHGGKIRVESTVGKGTAFLIRLPRGKSIDAAA